MQKLENRILGKTGLSVHPLGFGGAPIGLLDTEVTAVDKVLNYLLDEGINLIDTAAVYKDSEVVIGKVIGHRRNEFILTSKCGRQLDNLKGEEWTPEYISKTIDRSLQHLQTDHLDVMFLHSCTLEVLQQGEVVQALLKAKTEGKIRFAGYAGDAQAITYAAALPEIEVVEMTANLVDHANLEQPLATIVANNVGVLAKRAMANTAWSADLQKGFYRDYAKPYVERFQQMELSLESLEALDESITDWADLFLRFTLSIPNIHVGLTGTTSLTNAKKNVASYNRGKLNEEVFKTIQTAFKVAEKQSGETWKAFGIKFGAKK